MEYQEFLKTKQLKVADVGFAVSNDAIHPKLFEFQKDITRWAVKKGRVALFESVGLGKTIQFGEWMRQINKPTLIVSPLTVALQTVGELHRLLDLEVRYIRTSSDVNLNECLFYITNYDMLNHFDTSLFDAVILDESSILKRPDGITRNALIDMFKDTPYKLCATATPAPNDIAEIGNHAEFLGVMTLAQMQSVFFVHDSQLRNGAWRLKKHATESFYKWLASWSVALESPSDLGYSNDGFEKPAINHDVITVKTDYTEDGKLPGFESKTISATDAKKLRRETIPQRLDFARKLMADSTEQFIVWCDLNDESDALANALPDSVNVHGSMSRDDKIESIQAFVRGDIRILISKTSIAGMGVNLQNCHNMVWFGIGYSWEQFYQGLGRICRYGQVADTVNNYIITSEHESGIVDVIFEKDRQAQDMRKQLIKHMSVNSEVKHMSDKHDFKYSTDETTSDNFTMWLGDSTERMTEIESDSIHLSVYSPPFNDIFVYSNTERDLGNSANLDEFMRHYEYIIRENLRITMPGRICAVHMTQLRTLKGLHGYRGLIDWKGMLINAYVDAGWIYRGEITIDKDPQALAIRTKDNDLLFATLKRDSSASTPMNTEYLLVFKKPGDNPIPITPVANGDMTQEDWIQWARAVWYDIKETDVLNVAVARSNDDEKHMCPLALPIINRVVRMWSNPDETVFSPFGGIGSEGYEALRLKRKYHGIELKPEYYQTAVKNLELAEKENKQIDMFDWNDAVETAV